MLCTFFSPLPSLFVCEADVRVTDCSTLSLSLSVPLALKVGHGGFIRSPFLLTSLTPVL